MTMNDAQSSISGSVGYGGRNNYIDVATVQFLLNVARARTGIAPIDLDGKVGDETVGAIRDFQTKSFGVADGRVDVDGRSFRRLIAIHNEPELVRPTVYRSGKHDRYKVTVGQDGRIFVQSNDWLSKYSAAIYGDFVHIYDFGRMVDGTLHLLRNVNLIRAGEVLYHIPTWQKYMGARLKTPVPAPPPMSKDEMKKITQDAIKGDFQLKGDYGIKIVDFVGSALGYLAPAAEVLSYILPALEAAGTVLAFVVIPFEVYGYIRDFANVSDTDLRMYGLRAAAYATTAWAFGEPIPTSSPEIRRNHQQQFGGDLPRLQRLDKAWKDASDAAVRTQEQFAQDRLGPKASRTARIDAWKASLRGSANGNKSSLSQMIMKELGARYLNDAGPSVRRIWDLGLNSTPYPR